ncbi:hypothetical protein [Gluconobacter cerinus]|uniref:hypothetical protein n=1 Tax=Gluconobacter cerinus TaxID=38307 RepID=UPI001B8A9189|nr:hypothetical protein [Gluconobacter cerinus]MBS1026063.1 hypothetical protein [Gluconobacter cerinus]
MATINQPGQPISALPLADSVSPTDTLLGIITKAGATGANQVTILVLAQSISAAIGLDDAVEAAEAAAASASAKAEAAGNAASDTVMASRGKAGGLAALDLLGQLSLTDGKSLVPALKVLPATQTESALLSLLLTLDATARVRTVDGDVLISSFADRVLASKTFFDETGALRVTPANVGTLPDDVTVKDGLYYAGVKSLPTGLSNNGGLIITDGSVFYPGTYGNGGILAVNPNTSGA